MAAQKITAYEVRCHRCDVSFPMGTRRCIHCGGPTGQASGRAVLASLRPGQHSQPSQYSQPSQHSQSGGEVYLPEEEEEIESPRRSPFSPVALLWIVLFAAGTIYRACTGS